MNGGGFAACLTPHTTDPLPDGEHPFEVRAVDQAGNADPSAIRRRFAIDTTAPDAELVAKRGLKAGRRIRIDVSCDEDCGLTAKGRAVVPKAAHKGPTNGGAAVARKSFRLAKTTGASGPGGTTTLKLVPAGPRAKRRIARRVERGSKGKAKILVRAVDPLGNAARRRLTVGLGTR